LRKDLGFVDLAGNGKLVANLTAAEKTALLAKFTTTFTYDARGNLLTQTDGLGNQTSYTYTAFNKVASATSAMGNALASLDDLTPGDSFYRNKRVRLGFPNVGKRAAQKPRSRSHTTTYSYDAKRT
jgi:YD repeat-containing protein